MADEINKLLRYIVRHYTGPEEAKDIERDASASSTGHVDEDRRRALRSEEHRADELSKAFRTGLGRAHAASCAGGDAITLDDRDPEENQVADAMVRYLVGPGIATSRARETIPMHYTYIITVDWERLRKVAKEARVDLDQALKQSQ